MHTALTVLTVFEETVQLCKTRLRDPAISGPLAQAELAMKHHAPRQVLRACLQAARAIGEIEERNRMLAVIGR